MKSLKGVRGTRHGESAGCGEPVVAALHAEPGRLVAAAFRSPFPVPRARSKHA